ncbi:MULTISPECIES: response regulator transcription factor [Streptomyces]|uniref:response regulator transcription factor n=1 Tax=Streptomyces TaxID=1883 RepID=UPI0001852931|nr:MULTISPECIES: response regulator transcription factor [Streptomyces]
MGERTVPPRTVLSMPGSSSDRPSLARGAGQRLLVVAGDSDVAELLCATLELAGYRIVAVKAAVDGVARLTRERFDLVVVDATLPDVTELGRTRPTLAHRPPVLLLIDYESLGRIEPELGLGERDYVTRPFRAADVLTRVQLMLRGTGAGPVRGGTAIGLPPRAIRQWRQAVATGAAWRETVRARAGRGPCRG